MLTPAGTYTGSDETEKPRALRARAVILSFLFAVPVAYATVNQSVSAVFSMIAAPVGLLILLVACNVLLRRLLPRAALSQLDLVVIFSLTAVAAAIGTEWTNIMAEGISQFPLQARTSALGKNYFLKELPGWLIVKDKAVLRRIIFASQHMLNRAMMGLSRTLVPVASTVVGSYGQDRYGHPWQTQMIPSLVPYGNLAKYSSDSQEYQLWWVAMVRARNRVVDALKEATVSLKQIKRDLA